MGEVDKNIAFQISYPQTRVKILQLNLKKGLAKAISKNLLKKFSL